MQAFIILIEANFHFLLAVGIWPVKHVELWTAWQFSIFTSRKYFNFANTSNFASHITIIISKRFQPMPIVFGDYSQSSKTYSLLFYM
jgi:hypothetical protein